MKTIGLMALFVIITAILCGCPRLAPTMCSVSLSFQDASGKDLVEGIGNNSDPNYPGDPVDPALYTLRIYSEGEVLPVGFDSPFDEYKLCYSKFSSGPFVPYNYLYLPGGSGDSKAIYTYLLTCPYVFGDSAEHEIVAHYREKRGGDGTCYRLTFDGVEIQGLTDIMPTTTTAMIVLD